MYNPLNGESEVLSFHLCLKVIAFSNCREISKLKAVAANNYLDQSRQSKKICSSHLDSITLGWEN